MRLRRHILPLLLLFSMHDLVNGQSMYGTVLGNYAGVNSVQLNPSALQNSKTWLDVQFLGAGVFIQNNMLYQKKTDYKFSHFFQSSYEWPTHPESYGTEVRILYNYDNHRLKSAFVNIRVNGPGAMLIWGKHAFALTTAFRNVISAHNLPYELANFAYLGLNYKPQQKINYNDTRPFNVAQMAWAEIGLTYSYEVYGRGFNRINAGLTVRRLFGYAGTYANVKNIDYTVIDDSTVQIKNLNAEMGLSLPVDYQTNQFTGGTAFRGGGFGFDLGVTYTRLVKPHQEQYFNKLCAQRYEDYLYRVGVALIDVGGIRFKTNAQKLVVDNRPSYWDQVTRIKFRSIDQMLDTISYKFYGDASSAKASDKFTLWLPSALSVQFDYHLTKFTYVNASLIYPVSFAKATIYRPAELTLTPRYENRWLEVSLPVSLYDWYLPRVGLAIRAYGFTIGCDKLGGFFNFSDFTGIDVYFSIKYFLDKGSCRNKNNGRCGNLEFRPG
ncbi:MAG: DUF5723 family protein [Bacteroidetes bacterium]|nr:DUF5723 family protein [Bacteroidota bacterium]